MTAKRTARKPSAPGILLRYRDKDTAYGVTRKTATKLAQILGLSATQVVHVALANLARQTLPRYEADNGPVKKIRGLDSRAQILPCSPAPAAAGVHLLATIEHRAVVEKILRHLGLPTDVPRPAPPRSPPWLPGFAAPADALPEWPS